MLNTPQMSVKLWQTRNAWYVIASSTRFHKAARAQEHFLRTSPCKAWQRKRKGFLRMIGFVNSAWELCQWSSWRSRLQFASRFETRIETRYDGVHWNHLPYAVPRFSRTTQSATHLIVVSLFYLLAQCRSPSFCLRSKRWCKSWWTALVPGRLAQTRAR